MRLVFSKKYLWLLILGTLVSLVLVAVEMALAYILQSSMSYAFMLDEDNLVRALYVLFALVLAGALIKFAEKWLLGQYGSLTLYELRRVLAEKTQRIEVRRLERRHSGDWLSRLANDTSALQQFITNDLYQFVYQPLIFMAALAYLLYIDWQLVLICCTAIPLSVLLSINISRPLKGINTKAQAALSRYNTIVQETIDGMATIKANNMQSNLTGKSDQVVQEWRHASFRLERRRMLIVPLETVLRVVPFVLCIFVGGYRTLQQHISPEELLIFIYLINFLVQPGVILPALIARYKQTSACADRIMELIREPEERSDGEAAMLDEQPLVLEKVGFRYEEQNPALEDISFTFERGRIYALIGESGSGKSTLLKILTGMYEYDRGVVFLFGQPMNRLSLQDIRKQFAVVEQEPYLFPMSIEDNIMLADPNVSQLEARRAAQKANAHDFIMKFADGYRTFVADGGASLSGGQRQRIALARAILKDAPILLLDEAGSALDAQSEEKLLTAIKLLSEEGKTIIVIAHRLKVCEIADEVIVMKNGKIQYSGEHRMLLATSSEYAAMNRQSELHTHERSIKTAEEKER